MTCQALHKPINRVHIYDWVILRYAIPVALFLGVALIVNSLPIIETGTIESKSVKGINDHEVHVLLQDANEEIVVTDSKLLTGNVLDGKHLVVDDNMEAAMQNAYSGIQYYVSVRLYSKQKSREFLVSRDIFNQLKSGSVAKFEVRKSSPGEIKRIINERNENVISRRERYPIWNNHRQFMSY